MNNNTLTNVKERHKLAENYQEYTDKCFLRARQILDAENINPLVRYQVFARQDILRLKGVDEAVEFIKDITGDKAKIYALRNGVTYKACEPLMKLEGRVQDLIELETVYLGLISGNLTPSINMDRIREDARAIKGSAKNKPIYYFGARHFHPELDEQIARICHEEGFAGTSTDIGAKAWNSRGIGTIPHALILTYAIDIKEKELDLNPTVEATIGFDRYIDKAVPRIVLIDTFNKEITDSLETAKAVSNLKGVRIDTCGENYSQNPKGIWILNNSIPKKYLEGRGVTITGVKALRLALRGNGFKNLEITVSSGFNAEKTAAFMQEDEYFKEQYSTPLFDSIGTGSLANPIMTTSDIVAYFSEKEEKWKEMHKVGRPEIETNRLEERK